MQGSKHNFVTSIDNQCAKRYLFNFKNLYIFQVQILENKHLPDTTKHGCQCEHSCHTHTNSTRSDSGDINTYLTLLNIAVRVSIVDIPIPTLPGTDYEDINTT